MNSKQTYKYIKRDSILGDLVDEYKLTVLEYYKLYSFYVTYSLCGNQSEKNRKLTDYGWKNNKLSNCKLNNLLKNVIDFNDENFVFSDSNDLNDKFKELKLEDGPVSDLSFERCVIGITTAPNKYFKLFYRVRDGLAHGKYCLRLSKQNNKMVVIQDNDKHNVKARVVIKLQTLLDIIDVIDMKKLIQ